MQERRGEVEREEKSAGEERRSLQERREAKQEEKFAGEERSQVRGEVCQDC